MTIEGGIRLSEKQAEALLLDFDRAFDPALHVELDLLNYCKKLASNAFFVLAKEGMETIGFIAYYLNVEGHFCYIPLAAVAKGKRNEGRGRLMFQYLYSLMDSSMDTIRLEVLKSNVGALGFYLNEGFTLVGERDVRSILEKSLQ